MQEETVLEFKNVLERNMSQGHSAEEILEMAMKMQQSMSVYESGIKEICTKIYIHWFLMGGIMIS